MKRFGYTFLMLIFLTSYAFSIEWTFDTIPLSDEDKLILDETEKILLETDYYEKAKECFNQFEKTPDSVYVQELKKLVKQNIDFSSEMKKNFMPTIKFYTDGDYEKALQSVEDFLKKNPKDYIGISIRLMCLSKTNPELAIKECDKVLYYFPFNQQILSIKGDAYSELKLYKKAVKNYSISLFVKKSAVEYNSRGKAYYNLGYFNDALSDFNESIQLNQNGKNEAYLNRAAIYYLALENDKAVADCETYFNNGGKAVWGIKILASVYARTHDFEKSLKWCNEFINTSPNASDAYYTRGGTYLLMGQYKKALDDFNKAIKLNPRSSFAYSSRSETYKELNNIKKALEDSNMAIKYAETALEKCLAYKNRGIAYLAKNKNKLALADFEIALQYDESDELKDLIRQAQGL